MLDLNKIREFAQEHLSGSDLFLVDIKSTPGNDIEVLIDSDTAVSIDSCVELSRALNQQLETETDDFSLTVSSAGIGQPLKVFRQYAKLIGKPVEVVLKDGSKIKATLRDATPGGITLSYEEKLAVDGKKRKQVVETVKEFSLEEVKSTVEVLDYK